MPLSITEAADRWGLYSRKSVYNRINGLKAKGIDTELSIQGKHKRAYIPDRLLIHLDDLNSHLNKGGTIASFTPINRASVEVVDINSRLPLHTVTQPYVTIAPDSIEAIALGVARVLTPLLPPPDPTWKLQALRTAARFGYQMSTSQVRDLIDVTPTVKWGQASFIRGSFEFVKVGKIGRENAWIVKFFS